MWFAWLMMFGGLIGGVLLLHGAYALKSGVVYGKGGAYDRRTDPITYLLYVVGYIVLGIFQVLVAVLFGLAALRG